MKTKKSTSANLELKRKRFFLTGTTIALALTLAAFEWTTYFKVDCKFPPENPIDVWDTDMVPITFSKTPEKVIIEKKKKPTIEIKIVEKITPETKNTGEPEFPDIDIPENLFGAPEKPIKEKEIIVDWADVMPAFRCAENSEAELFRFLSQHTKYPRIAIDNKIEGTVYLAFVIDKRGKMKDIEVLSGLAGGCTEEAIRVVKMMDEWCPARNKGVPTSVRYKIPIKFALK